METNVKKRMATRDLVYISVFMVLIAVCAWISIPAAVPFTLQTMGIFCAVGILGGRRGTMAVLGYIILGALGVPVFSGFAGGIGYLMGNTGGYIIGFLFSALMMWGMERIFGRSRLVLGVSMAAGLLVCYVFGTAWFMVMYAHHTGAVGLGTVLGWCVFPFIIPDLLKITLAMYLTDRLKKVIDFL